MEIPHKRDERIDILRALAILCIILAHSMPPGVIFQLRNFDVTMMVFLMGASFFLSNRNKDIKYTKYLLKRFNRLILPTWKFLIFFFVLFYALSFVLNDNYYFPVKTMITSFALTSGIGYVWIMRVFFIIAIVSPLLLYISKKIKNNKTYFFILILSYGIYALLLFINQHITANGVQKLFEYSIIQCLGYILIAALGIRLYSLTKSQHIYISGFFLLIFVSLMIYHSFTPTQDYKYPPTIYYLSYGVFVSYISFYILSLNKVKKIFNKKPIIFLSNKSLDLYYCHIIPIFIIQLFGNEIPVISNNFITRFLFLFVGGLILLYLQTLLFNISKIKRNNKVIQKAL